MKQEHNNTKSKAIMDCMVESKNHNMDKQRVAILPIVIIIHAIVFTALVISSVWSITYIKEVPYFVVGPVPLPPPPVGGTGSGHDKTTTIKVHTVTNVPPMDIPIDLQPNFTHPDEPNGDGPPIDGQIDTDEWGKGYDPAIPDEPVKPATPPELPPQRIDTNGVQPQVLYRVTPEYPEILRKAHVQGMVILEAVINKDGTVRSVTVLRSDNAIFEKSASQAAMQWQFSPGTINGVPVAAYCTITIIFQLT
jgi:TonB family protein